MVHPVIPILRQVIGNAENQDAPEERYPRKDIVLMRKQNGQYLHAEPGKEWCEYELGESKAREIERFFVAGPFPAVETEGKLDHSQNDDEDHETVTMRMIRCSMVHAKATSGDLRILPGPTAAKIQRKKHQENGQRIDE